MQRGAGDAGDARGRTLGSVIREKDEELALFLEMRRREKEHGAAAAQQLMLAGDGGTEGDGMLSLDPPPPSGESFLPTPFLGGRILFFSPGEP
jgi:hypothetical protein